MLFLCFFLSKCVTDWLTEGVCVCVGGKWGMSEFIILIICTYIRKRLYTPCADVYRLIVWESFNVPLLGCCTFYECDMWCDAMVISRVQAVVSCCQSSLLLLLRSLAIAQSYHQRTLPLPESVASLRYSVVSYTILRSLYTLIYNTICMVCCKME